MPVTYKQVGEGCKYTIEPLYSGAGEVMTLSASKRREPARSGLMLETDVHFPLGTLVQLDIKFPGQEYTYRAKGIVSWIDAKLSPGKNPIGITITGMDKLDRYGISVSISEAEPSAPTPPATPAMTDMPMPPRVPLPRTASSYPPESSEDMEMDDTALNPIFADEFENNESDAVAQRDTANEFGVRESLIASEESAPELFAPLPEETLNRTHIRDFLTREDFTADTIPPSMASPPVGDHPHRTLSQKMHDPGVVKIVFQTLSLMMPQEGFGEKVYFEDVFVTAIDTVPSSLKQLLLQNTKRSDFRIVIDEQEAGRMCVVLPETDVSAPPSAYMIEQLLMMYAGTSVRVIRDREAFLTIDALACVTRLASPTASLRAVMGFDEDLLTQLIQYKDGPVAFDDEPSSIEEVAYDDRASRVSLVVAENNDRHRKTVPIEARVSTPPAKATEPIATEINAVVLEAFENMQHLFGPENHDEASNFALSLSRRLIRCQAAICTLLAPEQNELYISAIDGAIPETRLGARLSIADGLIGFCLRTGKVARSEQPQEIKASLLRETGLAVDNIMCAPITVRNHNIGAIELINSTEPTGFTRESADLLAYITNSLADFIEGTTP